MKKIILGISLLSFAAMANTTVNTVKVADGKTATCKSKLDLYRNRTGAYSAKAVAATADDQSISVDVELKFLACTQTNDAIQFVLKGPLETSTYQTVTTVAGQRNEVQVTPSDVRLKAFKDGIYKILNNTELSNESIQEQTITVALADVLNPEQMLKLDEQKIITGSFDIWVSKKLNFVVEQTGTDFTQLSNFGSYRIHFKLTKDEKGTSITLL
ncbi:MAG: hypothetical protein COW00_13060 [Bdellovibrio sp. CG12_big_fil_rev_8_21_14_0_65_39_13]|nr:MAG: hypothetical protein COW78_05380 [Bdellovibrio sp. CG22_combo_CG10-13_8_21_14_all_39_27]PIQ59009.1 MAG: hypothetical protein COW00_13060 [Bdellovibrio sp. CG12_big_fil_rev_8_21_14_0_65_39_13]PIR33439.1 MAG: hypothetical protein COV37_16330 [Bdellovibrio sp. CG11_big_fil_rev_8_21_14_0_20_39_38]